MRAEGLPEYVSSAKQGGWHIAVRVQPGAKRTELMGVKNGRLRIRLNAPAVDNKANKALVAFIARILGLKPARVVLVAGDTAREKRIWLDMESAPDWKLLHHGEQTMPQGLSPSTNYDFLPDDPHV